MHKILIGVALGIVLLSKPAAAACTTITQFQNGYTADAGAVNTNFNNLNTCAAPLASPSFTGSLGLTVTSASPGLSVTNAIGSANVSFKSTSSAGQASLTLDGGAGQASQTYLYNSGTVYWAYGLTGGGSTNVSFFNYPSGQNVLVLQSNGNASVAGCLTANGGQVGTCLSDARTKKNIAPFRVGLQQIVGLNPITFQYNGVGDTPTDGRVRTGLLAQEVRASASELVQPSSVKFSKSDKSGEPLLAVKYGDLTFALINAVKELKSANDNQAARIEQLESRVANLQRKLGLQTASR